ncbi:hypothetical protein COBT_000535 [Conglomerata obtusa]
MEIVNALNKLYVKANSNTLCKSDFENLKGYFLTKTIGAQSVKHYNAQDSRKLVYTLIKSTSIKIYNLLSLSELFINDFENAILDEMHNSLFIDYTFVLSDCYIDFAKLKKTLSVNCLEIFKRVKSNFLSDKINFYLQNKDEIDFIGINFALIAEDCSKIKNRDLKLLHEKKLDKKFLILAHKHKEDIVNENKKEIYQLCRQKLLDNKGLISIGTEDTKKCLYFMAIISEINPFLNEKDLKLLKIIPDEISEPYLGFILSMMVDEESIIQGWNVLMENGFVSDIFLELQKLHSYLHMDKTNDIEKNLHVINFGLSIFIKAAFSIPKIHPFFIRNIDTIINLLWTELPYKLLGNQFKFISYFIYDDEIRNKIYDYLLSANIFCKRTRLNDFLIDSGETYIYNKKNIFEIMNEELKQSKFDVTEGFVVLCSNFLKYNLFENEITEFYMCALKSNDKEILSKILSIISMDKLFEQESVLKGIKKGIEKDEQINNIFLEYVIKNAKNLVNKNLLLKISKNVDLMNSIVKTRSLLFFPFLELFNPEIFTIFLNDDFLDRINDDIEKGLEYLGKACKDKNDFCRFVLRKKTFFNNIEEQITKKLVIYRILADNFIQDLDLEKSKNHLNVPKFQNNDFFYILYNLIAYKSIKGEDIKKYKIEKYVFNEENLENYCNYLKTLIVFENNVENQISDLLSYNLQNEYIASLIGYYKSIKKDSKNIYPYECISLKSKILNTFNNYDNELFLKTFKKSNLYEKFLLFFILDSKNINKEIFCLIIEEIKMIIKQNNFQGANEYLLKQCLNSLLHTNDLNELIKILNGVILPNSFNDLLIKLCLKNIINQGREVLDLATLMKANLEYQVKCCFLIYAYKLMTIVEIKQWIETLRKQILDDDLEIIRKELLREKYN